MASDRPTLDQQVEAVSLGELRRMATRAVVDGPASDKSAAELIANTVIFFAERLDSIETSLRILAEEASDSGEVA